MNIEGAEIEALQGGLNTIIDHRPKLAIALYHDPCHIWEIPEFLQRNLKEYNFKLRHYDGGIVETIIYGIPK